MKLAAPLLLGSRRPASSLLLALLLPAFLARAQADGGYSLSHEEGYVEVWLTTPEGETGLTRSVLVTLTRVSWEVWTRDDTGESEVRNPQYNPVSGLEVSFSIEAGDGFVSPNPVTTDSGGQAWTSFFFSGSSAVTAS